jgi:protein-S-isoprenylcysteine O-methyltransferase Ste14
VIVIVTSEGAIEGSGAFSSAITRSIAPASPDRLGQRELHGLVDALVATAEARVLTVTVEPPVRCDAAGVTRVRAAIGSLLFLVVAPGVVAGLVPWLVTRWSAHDWSLPVRVFGAVLIMLGVAFLLSAFVRFAAEGIGTPAPVAPTERLVVGGAYRYVRNPMYLAVAAVIVGEALLLGQAVLLLYAFGFGVAVAAFVHGYEEPTLVRRFGEEYEAYRREVPRWLPRLSPWRGSSP